MKHTALLLFLSALLVFGTLVVSSGAAQENDETEMYARSFYIQRIYPNRNGYRIVYTNDAGSHHEMFAPIGWFSKDDGEAQLAELRHGRNPAYPYMEVFWKNGEFSHMKVFAREDYSHESWGTWINEPDNVEELFDVDEPQFNL